MTARNPNNNPTDRILRLLAEIDELSAAYDDLYRGVQHYGISLPNIMPKPSLIEFRLELQRQGNTYMRTRPNVIRARERMRHIRDRDAMQDEKDEPRIRIRHRQPIPQKRNNPVMVDSPNSEYNMPHDMPYHIDDELAKQIAEDNKMMAEEKLAKQKLIDDIIRKNPAVIMPEHIVAGNDYKPPKDLFSKNKPDAPQED
jgi:hypothetical protein